MLSVVLVCCCGQGCGHHLQLWEWLQYQLSSPKHTHTHTHQLEPKHSESLQFQYIFGHIQRFFLLFITFLYYSDQHALNQQLWWDPEWGHSLWGVSIKPRGWWWCVEECGTQWTQPWSYSNPLLTSEVPDPRCSDSTPSNLQPSKMTSFLQTVSGWLHPVRLSYTAPWSIMAEIYSRVRASVPRAAEWGWTAEHDAVFVGRSENVTEIRILVRCVMQETLNAQ